MFFDDLDESAIPKFTHDGNLPSFTGDATDFHGRSPFNAYIGDFIKKYAVTEKRSKILKGFTSLREEFVKLGCSGYQWINGSFVSNTKKEPGDIDVVTFIDYNKEISSIVEGLKKNHMLTDFDSKLFYNCDSYVVDMSKYVSNKDIAFMSTYWYGLFSHTREKLWKGFIEIELPNTIRECSFCHAMIDRMGIDYALCY